MYIILKSINCRIKIYKSKSIPNRNLNTNKIHESKNFTAIILKNRRTKCFRNQALSWFTVEVREGWTQKANCTKISFIKKDDK